MQVCKTLENWCQDTRDWSKKGVLSSLGIGTSRSRTLDPRFRLVVRIIYTYLVVRLADKGLSIHQNSTGGGGVLAWRKGRQQSIDESRPGGSATSPPPVTMSKGSGKDPSSVLIETLAQLPVKNKDYAAIFVKSSSSSSSSSTAMVPSPGLLVARSSPGVVTAAAASMATAAMAIPVRLIASSISLSSSLSMSPQQPSAMPSSPTALFSSSPPLRSLSSSVPAQSGFSLYNPNNSNNNTRNKRLSMHSQHSSRFSTSSWDESAGVIFALDEGHHETNGGHHSHINSFNPLLPPLPPSALWRRERQRSRTPSQQQNTLMPFGLQQQQKRLGNRQQDGTKNGLADLEWAVEQIRDRRFRILEAAEILREVLSRFYERDAFLA